MPVIQSRNNNKNKHTMIQRLYRLLLLFCSIAVFAACSDSDGNENNGGNGGEQIPDGGDTYGYITDANRPTPRASMY